MADLIEHADDNPEFARVIELSRIRDLAEFPFDISPNPAESDALARLMDAQALRKLRFAGKLTALPKGGWQLDAELGATVIQTCVVSLDPVTTRVDQPVRRAYLPAAAAAWAIEVIDNPEDEEDDVEPLSDRIDLGLVAVEALALALPPYPRKPDAALPPEVTGEGQGALKPFAALAALRDKLSEGS